MENLNVELQDWKEMLLANNTKDTVRHYLRWARRFEDWLEMEPGRDALAEFDELLRDGDALRDLRDRAGSFDSWSGAQVPRGGYAYSSRVVAISGVKSWVDYRYGVEWGGRQQNQVQNICRGEPAVFDPVVARPSKVREVLEETRGCEADSCHAMAITGYDAIMRGVELCNARFDDLDLDRGTIYVRGAKGSESRHVRLHESTLDVLADYRELVLERFDDPEYLFYAFYQHWWNKPWHPSSWSKHFSNRHWDAGWHSLGRHSAVTNRLRNGESISSVNQRARHSSIEMTSKYNQLAENGGDPLPELA